MTSKGFLTLGTISGLYLGAVGLDVYKAASAERQLQAQASSELQAADAAEASAKREEAVIGRFEETIQLQKQSVDSVDAEITVVQQRLTELQQQREARLKEVGETEGALEEARTKLIKAVQEAKRHRTAATAAEQAMAAAHQHTLAARQGINPLQHPLVRVFTGRS